MSLLGAVAYASLTRPDAMTYICDLQRVFLSHAANHPHQETERVDKMDASNSERDSLLQVLSRQSPYQNDYVLASCVRRRSLQTGRIKKGHSMRGVCFTLGTGDAHESFSATCKGHLLDFACKSQRHVTRSYVFG